MSVLFFKMAGTTFFLFLYGLLIAAVFVDKDELLAKEWEEQPKHTRIIGICLTILFVSTFTSILGAFIAKIWGY